MKAVLSLPCLNHHPSACMYQALNMCLVTECVEETVRYLYWIISHPRWSVARELDYGISERVGLD